MSGLLLAGRLLLASILALAGIGKLLDLDGSRSSVERVGLTSRLIRPAAVLVPLFELALAAALVPATSARWAALASAALLAVFSVAIARSLLRRETHDCGCFGALGSSRVGPVSLARNVALAALAGWVAATGPGKSLVSVEISPLGVTVVVLGCAMIVLAWSGWQLFRQSGRLLERVRTLEESARDRDPRPAAPSGLPVGAPAPTFALDDLSGSRRTLADLLAARLPVALAFSDPDCGACARLIPLLERLHEEHAGSLEVALITRGDPNRNRAQLDGSRLEHVLVQEDRELFELYRISTVPSATIVGADGRIASPTVSGDLGIEELLGSATVGAPELSRVGS